MNRDDSKLLPPLTWAITDCLEERGASRREVSLATNHGEGWLSEMLNPKRSSPLTVPAIEQVASFLECDPVELIWKAFPNPATSENPYDLLYAYSPDAQDGEIASRVAEQLTDLLGRQLNVTTVDPTIDLDLVESMADAVWHDRTNAYQAAFFKVADLFSQPRKIHTLAICLALLSEILRTLRTSDFYFRAQLLKRAYWLVRQYPNRAAEAYIDERTAYFLWNILSDPAVASRVLERPGMARHPLPHRLLTAKALFQYLLCNYDIALGHLRLAERIPSSNAIFQSLVQNMIAGASMQMGDFDGAKKALHRSMKFPNLPEDVVYNNLALEAQSLLLQGELSAAIPVMLETLHSQYVIRWPDKAMYVATDLLEAAEAEKHQLNRETIDRLILLQNQLLPTHPVEGTLKKALQRGIAAASSRVTIALQRNLGDPNG